MGSLHDGRISVLHAVEPTGALDSEGGIEILELFHRLHDDGQTILMVTHFDDVALRASWVLRMRDGRIADGGDGPASKLAAMGTGGL